MARNGKNGLKKLLEVGAKGRKKNKKMTKRKKRAINHRKYGKNEMGELSGAADFSIQFSKMFGVLIYHLGRNVRLIHTGKHPSDGARANRGPQPCRVKLFPQRPHREEWLVPPCCPPFHSSPFYPSTCRNY